LAQKVRTRVNDLYGYYAVLNNKLVVVNVLDEEVERGKPLLDAFIHQIPFLRGNDAGYNIKREYFFNTLAAVINGKCYPLAHEKALGQLFFFVKIIGRFGRNIIDHLPVLVA